MISTQPLLDVSMIPDIAGAIPGRRMGISAGSFRDDACVDTSLLRHPGLVPGPWLAPGPTKKGRDVEIIPAGCFQDPGYRWGDSGTTDENIAGGDFVTTPYRHPGLVPGSI